MPDLTEARIAELVHDLFAHVLVGPEARASVIGLLGGADRHYHGLAHIALHWQRHLQFRPGTSLAAARPTRLIASAIAYHDAVYDAERSDNEARSAALWREHAARGAMPASEVSWVSETIFATSGHAEGRHRWERARAWMLDLDLAPLGASADGFARDTALVRAEYAHLTDAEWVARRARFLASLAARPTLFRTPKFRDAFEAAARRNIGTALDGLRSFHPDNIW